jgi:pimeloyl-ACP methyl ester carboxylesterase
LKVKHQESFKALTESEAGEHSLAVHQRGGGEPNLVVLIHGLGGDRYGTWKLLPEFLFEDLNDCAVGLYGYDSGLKRVGSDQFSVDIEKHAEELAFTIRDSGFRRIVLVGHSMGGLLAKSVIARLIGTGSSSNSSEPTVERIAGLFLLATPQAGAKGFYGLFGFPADKRALKMHGPLVTRLEEVFTNHVCTDLRDSGEGRSVRIPAYVGYATNDRWVAPLCAGVGVPDDQKKLVRGTHRHFVKAAARDADLYGWLLKEIQGCLSAVRPKRAASDYPYRTRPEYRVCRSRGPVETTCGKSGHGHHE